MSKSDWWRVENLSSQERLTRTVDEVSRLEPQTDYGSYRMLLLGKGRAETQIASHNDVNPSSKVAAIARLLRIKSPRRILDAGCGVGFTTEALARYYPTAKVLGVDISEDGIAYAEKIHRIATFKVLPLAPEEEKVGRFDLIFCFEFYPFTRNTDVVVQTEYVRYFMGQLEEHGQLILYQCWSNPDSLSAIYEEVKHSLPEYFFVLHTIPHPKLLSWLPFYFSRMLAVVIERLTGREVLRKVLCIEREGGSGP